MSPTRRSVLTAVGLSAVGTGAGYTYFREFRGREPPSAPGEGGGETAWRLRKLGRAGLSADGGGYADVAVREDGRYAVVGTKRGTSGSFLVDLDDPSAPVERHYLPTSERERCPDVKFDSRDGLYYRTLSVPRSHDGEGSSVVDVVDYGYDRGTPDDPVVASYLGGGSTHNLCVHPAEPLLYTVNYADGAESPGFDVWDLADPSAPRRLGSVGPPGSLHDVVYDPERDLIHCAYMGGGLDGYVAMDASDPRRPTERGRFDYEGRPGYEAVGRPGFRGAHHANYDPRRDIVVIGDERPYGIPGGKHVLDIGWRDGSPADPVHVGFTHSPNAREMDPDADGDGRTNHSEKFDWTGHDFDFVPLDDRTLLVSGDYSEGVVLYDLTDPTAPDPLARYATDDGAGPANDVLAAYGDPPRAWDARYCGQREFVVASDQFTGLYTFEVAPATPEEAASTLPVD